MKKKNLLTLLLIGVQIFLLCACSSPVEEKKIEEENSILIEAEDLRDALKQYRRLVENAETEEEKQELELYMNEYILEDINGFYYYWKADTEGEWAIEQGRQESVKEDNRAIYVKSKEEVYIAPYSEQELTDMQLTLEDIPDIENSEIYKYHVVEIEFEELGNNFGGSVILESDYVNGSGCEKFNSITIHCNSGYSELYYSISGYFADQTNEIGKYDKENAIDIEDYRKYYRDESIAVSEKEEREEKAEAKRESKKAEKNAEPAIGMTEAEVIGGAWGSPDKRNIDEYEWGTEEQWVYDDKGYVYFEDGIVTAVQHR